MGSMPITITLFNSNNNNSCLPLNFSSTDSVN